MRIKKIEIISFGKFKNFSMDFSEGFNLIFGKNEDGKSTVMAFISLMLYGSAGSSSRTDISGNFRKKYAPWSGEKMSGDMEIECGGRSYRIHKEFRATAKTDKVTVTDTETGNAVNLPPDTEIGKYFLGIDCNAFEKSVFGANADSFAGTESGDISTRLSNLTESGDETVSPKNVLSRIEGAMDELVKKRSKGKIALAQDRIEELTAHIQNLNYQAKQRKMLALEYTKTEEEIAVLSEKAKMIQLARENEENRRKAKTYKTLAHLYENVRNAEQEIEEKVGTGNAVEILKRCEEYKNAIAVAKDVLSKTEKISLKNSVSEEDMKNYFVLSERKKTAVENERKAENNKKKALITAISGVVISIIGAIGGMFNSLSFLAIPVGLILLIFGLFKFNYKRKDTELAEIERQLSELFASRSCLSAEEFERAYHDGIASAEKAKIYDEALKSFINSETAFIKYVDEYESVSSCGDAENFVKCLYGLLGNLEKAQRDTKSYASACQIEESNPEVLLNLAQDIEKDLTDEIENPEMAGKIEQEIKEKNATLLDIKGKLGAEPDDIAPFIRELEELQEKLNEMQSYYKDLTLAREVLLESEDEMRRSFAPALKERASEILSTLTDGKYNSLSTDKTYEIEVKSDESGGYRSRHYLSRGTLGQSYLALRIALCEMLSENETVPLLLDDVLADYDDERMALASKFLENYAKDGRQVLFFTCHGWLGEIRAKHNMVK